MSCEVCKVEIDRLTWENTRLKISIEHTFRMENFQAHQNGDVENCPLCEALKTLKGP